MYKIAHHIGALNNVLLQIPTTLMEDFVEWYPSKQFGTQQFRNIFTVNDLTTTI